MTIDMMERVWMPRAGFWRRLGAFFVDYLVMFVPLYLVVVALFSLTNGAVQGTFLLRFGACYEATMNWESAPPAGIDTWALCKTSVFGLTTAIQAVGTNTESGEQVTFAVGADGEIREAVFDAGIVEWPVLLVYLFFMEWRSGRPIGKRLIGIVVHDEDDERRDGLPISKAFRRQLAKAAGLLPMTLMQIAYLVAEWMGWFSTANEQSSTIWIIIAAASMAIAIAWFVWIAVSIMLGNDPIHDRMAETIVRIDTD